MNEAQFRLLLEAVWGFVNSFDRLVRKIEPVLDYALEEIKKERGH